jgi:Spy/CpxP family protein refolding chaperone
MKIQRIVLCVMAAGLLIGTALAQGGAPKPGQGPQRGGQGEGRRMGGMGMGGMMLMMPELQKELKITTAQKTAIEKIMKEMQAQPRDKATRESMEKFQTRIMATLTATQKARLKQIQLQSRGGSALLDPEVQKQLAITAAQKTKLTALQEQIRKDSRAKMEAARKANKPMDMAAMQSQRKASDAKLMAVLSAAQKTKWTAMIGKPFAMPDRRNGRSG